MAGARDEQRFEAGGPDRPTGIGWSLWAVALALPWLLPTHADPWTTFYSEVLMGAVLLPMACWALWAARGTWRVDVLAGAFAVAAVVPLLQALGGMYTFPAEAPLVSQYLIAFALTLMIARHAEEAAPYRLVDALFAGLAIAAIASTGLALYQRLGLDAFGVMVVRVPSGERPVANVGQSNNLSTLLVWGLVAIWWAHSRRAIGRAGATIAAAFLLLGVALTGSRTGFLAVGLLCAAALFGRNVLRTKGQAPVWFALAAWFIVLLAALQPLADLMLLEGTRSLSNEEGPRARLMIYRFALEALSQQPWQGYGWNQIVTAHVGAAAQFPMHGIVMHAHNIVLDLFLWNGIPLGTLMVIGLCLWLWHALRNVTNAEQALLVLGLVVLALHAVLELPHVFAYFLLPAALMMGALNARRPLPTVVNLPRLAIGAAVLLQAGILVLMFDEYGQIEASETAANMRAARIANVAPTAEPKILVLRSLHDGLVTLRTVPRRGMTTEDMDRMRRAITRYPTYSALFRYAQVSALNGRSDDAKWALGVLCSLHARVVCQAAATGWAQLASNGDPEFEPFQLLPYDTKQVTPSVPLR